MRLIVWALLCGCDAHAMRLFTTRRVLLHARAPAPLCITARGAAAADGRQRVPHSWHTPPRAVRLPRHTPLCASAAVAVGGGALDVFGAILKFCWKAGVVATAWPIASKGLTVAGLGRAAALMDRAITGVLAAVVHRLASTFNSLARRVDDAHANAAMRVDAPPPSPPPAASPPPPAASPPPPAASPPPPAAAPPQRVTTKVRMPPKGAGKGASLQDGARAAGSGAAAARTVTEGEIRQSLVGLRVRDLKGELARLGVSSAGAIEKEDLVERLVAARLSPPPPPPPAAPASATEVVRDGDGERVAGGGFGGGLGGLGDAAKQMGVSESDALKMAEAMFADPEAMSIMSEIESKPNVQQAMLEMAQGGEAAALKYASDAEVMHYMRKLEQLGLNAGFTPPTE
jgi:hypothetical protein